MASTLSTPQVVNEPRVQNVQDSVSPCTEESKPHDERILSAPDRLPNDIPKLATCDPRPASSTSASHQDCQPIKQHFHSDQQSFPSYRHFGHRPSDHTEPLRGILPSQSTAKTSITSSNGVHGERPTALDNPRPGDSILPPRFKRSRSSNTVYTLDESPTPTTLIASPPLQPDLSWSRTGAISLKVFEEIVSLYRRLCVWPPAPWDAFEHVDLPKRETLEHYLHLYHLHFDQVLPFWHAVMLENAEQHPVLFVTMSAIGSNYVEGESKIHNSLLEFGRRYLLVILESTADGRLESVSVAQAQLLQIVGMAYSEHESFRRRAIDGKRELARILTLCQREMEKCTASSTPLDSDDDGHSWHSWCHNESLVRLASSAWLVDSMMAYHFDSQPILDLRDMGQLLPCADETWSAKTAQEWRSPQAGGPSHLSLVDAMQDLYVTKRFSQVKGEFAQVLIIHGLLQRTWEVQRYFESPLSSWAPSVRRDIGTALPPTVPIHQPSITEVKSWQSATCDALDLMHWQANAAIGSSGGLEQPTVLHLHVAKLVILAPHVQITHLARTMASGQVRLEDDSLAKSKHVVQEWANQRQKLARTATVHAGLIYWHLRRYTISGFYEAHSLALAALVLWAFGTFSSGAGAQGLESADNEESEQSDDAMCEIILIDRPTDQELVQQFIQHGHSMRVHMTGVEDLYGPRGPESVLEQGCRLLSSLRWGASASWLQVLQMLAEVSRKRRESPDD